MPTYEYKCTVCGKDTTKINKVDDRRTNAPICQCGSVTKFFISTPMINSVRAARFENYKCPVTDQIVTSERQKKNIEAREGLIIKEKGMFPPRKPKFVDETPEVLQKELKKYTQEINQ